VTNERVAIRDKAAVEESEGQVREVLERFKERTTGLNAVAEQATAQSTAIKNEVSEALVQLQFQDRTSQILGQVIFAIDQMLTLKYSDGATMEEQARSCLDRMARTYTTDEQRSNHAGLDSRNLESQAITFF
jgi:methyl-accepting chemotaxis protein